MGGCVSAHVVQKVDVDFKKVPPYGLQSSGASDEIVPGYSLIAEGSAADNNALFAPMELVSPPPQSPEGNEEAGFAENRPHVAILKSILASARLGNSIAVRYVTVFKVDRGQHLRMASVYSNIRRIGSGGCGIVYDCEVATPPGEPVSHVALKRLQRRADGTVRCPNEIVLWSSLQHDNIVRFRRFFLSDEFVWIEMDIWAGGDLESYIHQLKRFKNRLKTASVVRIAYDVLRALAFINTFGIAHRDVKLSNIYLSHDKTSVALGDFGFCAFVEHSREPMQSMQTLPRVSPDNGGLLELDQIIREPTEKPVGGSGTPRFMAPEVLREKKVFIESDVWSLGVAALYMRGAEDFLNRLEPQKVPIAAYSAENFDALQRMVTGEFFSDDAAFGEVVMAMLERDVMARQSAKELLEHRAFDEVRRAREGEGTQGTTQ
jgi:serine/threonine protein kinase